MKRLLIILLTLAMLFLAACDNKNDTVSDTVKPATQSEQQKDDISTPDESSVPTDNSSDEQTTETDKQEDTSFSDDDKTCDHVFIAPTCNYPETCAKCKLTRGKANGHIYSDATCTKPAKCKGCGDKKGEPLGHSFGNAGCTTAAKCQRCDFTQGEGVGHMWSSEKCGRCNVSIKSLASSGEKINIACVGDSITNNGYWKNNLFGNLPDYYNVSGFGVNGATGLLAGIDVGSPKPYMSQSLYKNSLSFEPDAVVIMLGTNDSKPCNFDKIKKDSGAQYKKDIIALISSYKALINTPQIFIALPPTVFGNGTSYEGINNPSLESTIIPLLKEVAKETGATVIDTHEATKNASAHFSDGVHPSDDQGRKIIAKAVADAILNKYQ